MWELHKRLLQSYMAAALGCGTIDAGCRLQLSLLSIARHARQVGATYFKGPAHALHDLLHDLRDRFSIKS
jgi:hypothetical protein